MPAIQWTPKLDEELLYRRNVLRETIHKIAAAMHYGPTSIGRRLKILNPNGRPKSTIKQCKVCGEGFKRQHREKKMQFEKRDICSDPLCDKFEDQKPKPQPQIAVLYDPWPAGMKFEDAEVVELPDFSKIPKPDGQFRSLIGSASSMIDQKGGPKR